MINRLIAISFLLSCVSCVNNTKNLAQDVRKEMQDLRLIQADQSSTINELREEVRQLRGVQQEIQYSSSDKTRELEQTIEKLGSRVPPPAGVPESLLAADEKKISTHSGTGADSYKLALARLRAGDFQNSDRMFSDFLSKNPKTTFSDNAYFWRGIIAKNQSQFDKSVLHFSEVYQKFPAEDMVPASLFYMSEALQDSGASKDSKFTLEKLVDEHPSSSYAMRAKVILGNK